MTHHGSASPRKHESHTGNGNLIDQINQLISGGSQLVHNTLDADQAEPAMTPREYDREGVPRKSHDITANLKRRARRLAVDGWVDGGTRRLIRYALQNRDPYLVQLVTRVEAGEMRIDHLILDTD
jgi:hypothetical protein